MSEECNNERKESTTGRGGRGEGRRGGGEREREDDGGGEVEEEIYRVELQRRLTPEFTMCRRYWRDLLRER